MNIFIALLVAASASAINVFEGLGDKCSTTMGIQSDFVCGSNLSCSAKNVCEATPGFTCSAENVACEKKKSSCCKGTTCTSVNAIIGGKLGSKDICVPNPTSTTRVKRGVKVGGPAATNYCYSGCSGVKVI